MPAVPQDHRHNRDPTTLVFALVALTLYLRAPVERIATLEFRAVFEGMDRGQCAPAGGRERGAPPGAQVRPT